jgi:hypothetical protein
MAPAMRPRLSDFLAVQQALHRHQTALQLLGVLAQARDGFGLERLFLFHNADFRFVPGKPCPLRDDHTVNGDALTGF